jgi:hypothetical protein
MAGRKKSTGEKLVENIGRALKIPALVDQYVKEQPHLNHNEAFVEGALAAKDLIQSLRPILTLIIDTTTLFDKKEQTEDDEWKP